MEVRPPAGHAEPSLALLRTPVGEILALRLPEGLRMTVQLSFALPSPCVRAEVFDKGGTGFTMSATMGRLLAAGQRAEVFEWGSRVVKLCRSTGSKQVIFREAAINAAVEALGLPVPAVWSVQQIDGRWGIVFDRVSGFHSPSRCWVTLPPYPSVFRSSCACKRAFTPTWWISSAA